MVARKVKANVSSQGERGSALTIHTVSLVRGYYKGHNPDLEPLNVQETVMDVEGSALRQDKPGRTSYEVRSFSRSFYLTS